jgi:FKBP-type peptidyl-prolyl cis-trans isomerase FklB
LAKGIQDVMEQNKPDMSYEDAQAVINEFFTALQAKVSEKGQAEGKAFLAENAKRNEVVTLASGLQYEVMTAGNGAIPTASNSVKVHYHGTTIDGNVFDSSVSRGEPATFGVTQVISGWVEALQLMPVGSKWKLFIPSDLAYGAQGAGQAIAPHATLIFEVELLDIV